MSGAHERRTVEATFMSLENKRLQTEEHRLRNVSDAIQLLDDLDLSFAHGSDFHAKLHRVRTVASQSLKDARSLIVGTGQIMRIITKERKTIYDKLEKTSL